MPKLQRVPVAKASLKCLRHIVLVYVHIYFFFIEHVSIIIFLSLSLCVCDENARVYAVCTSFFFLYKMSRGPKTIKFGDVAAHCRSFIFTAGLCTTTCSRHADNWETGDLHWKAWRKIPAAGLLEPTTKFRFSLVFDSWLKTGRPYLDGFIEGLQETSNVSNFVLLVVNGGDAPLTQDLKEQLLGQNEPMMLPASRMRTQKVCLVFLGEWGELLHQVFVSIASKCLRILQLQGLRGCFANNLHATRTKPQSNIFWGSGNMRSSLKDSRARHSTIFYPLPLGWATCCQHMLVQWLTKRFYTNICCTDNQLIHAMHIKVVLITLSGLTSEGLLEQVGMRAPTWEKRDRRLLVTPMRPLGSIWLSLWFKRCTIQIHAVKTEKWFLAKLRLHNRIRKQYLATWASLCWCFRLNQYESMAVLRKFWRLPNIPLLYGSSRSL